MTHVATLGVRVHSGWAAVVVLRGPLDRAVVVHRSRIELANPDDAGSIQPYHTAEGLPLARAEPLLRRYLKTAKRRAEEAVGGVLEVVRKQGLEVRACGLLLGSGRRGLALEAILASHALIHTADGNHFRDAVSHGCERHGLRVVGVVERELVERGAAALGIAPADVKSWRSQLGRDIGPPWRQDEKYAALAAVVAAAGAPKRG